MPFTLELDEHYSVTISSQRRRDRNWESDGEIFVTATCRDIGVSVWGEGRSLPAAEARALAEARRRCPSGPPDSDEDD